MAIKNNSVNIRTDPNFVKEIQEMQKKRQEKFDVERLKPKSPRRITLAMTRHELFPRIKKDIINADLK